MKKHGFRSIFSLLLALMMVCSMLPTAAFAEGDVEEQPVVVEPEGTPAGELKQDEVKPPEGGTPEEPKQDEVKPPEDETSQGPAKPADADHGDADVPGGKTLTLPLMPGPDSGDTANNAKSGNNSTVVLHPSVNSTVTGVKVSVGGTLSGYTIKSISGYDITVDLGTYNVNNGTFRLPYAKDIWYGVDDNKVDYISWAGGGSNRRSEGASALLANGKNTAYYYFKGVPVMPIFTLKYDANGGTGAPASQTYTATSKYEGSYTFTISSQEPTRDGYTFLGWSTNPNATTADRQPGGSIVVTGTTTLYAVWETKTPPQPAPSSPPTFGELVNILSAEAVKVVCINTAAGHAEAAYALKKDTIINTSFSGGPNGHTYTFDINSAEYVAAYNETTGKTHTPGDAVAPVTLVWQNGGWKVQSGIPAIFRVACDAQPEETYTVTYKDGVDGTVFADDVHSGLKSGEATPAYKGGTPTRDGFTFQGWEPEVAQNVTGNATYTAKWEEESTQPGGPSKEKVIEIYGNVTINCTTLHGSKSYPLTEDTIEIGPVTYREDLKGYTCMVYISSAPYVEKFDTEHGGVKHTVDFVGKGFEFHYLNGQWFAPSNDDGTIPIVFNVKCEEQQPQPYKPSDDEVKELLGDDAVNVICTNEASGHGGRLYGLLDSTFEVRYDGQYGCEVIVTPAEYVRQFDIDWEVEQGTHASDASRTNQSIINLKWVEGKWTAVDAPAKFYVLCVNEPPIEIPNPEVEKLLKVDVICTTSNNAHVDGNAPYALIGGTYSTSAINNEGDVPTCTVTVRAEEYVKLFNSNIEKEHTLIDEDSKTITLRYVGNEWKAENDGYVDFKVKCKTQPEVPGDITDEDLAKLKVVIHCTTNGSHTDRTYDLIAGNYSLDYSDEGFTCYIAVLAAPYVNEYISDTGTNHELVDPQKSSKTITLRWNTETKAWAADSNSVTFDVKCTTQEGPAAPTAEQVASLLKVKVSCANLSAAHQENVPAFVYQPLLRGSFDIGEVTGNAQSGYACRITVRAAQYVQDFNTRSNATHTPTDGTEKAVTLYYEDGGWTVGTGSGLVEFTVICENVPAQKYTVTYTDGVDGVEIFKDQVYADLTAGTATPKFDGTPTRVGYFFAGWNPAVADTVTGNVTYTASWKVDSNNNGKPDDEEERYTVTYLDGANGKAFASQVYPGLLSGTATPKFNGTPVRSGYVFIGWSPVWSATVTGNVTYTATWSTITGGLDKVPKTGDNGLTLALSALLLFSFCGAAACVVSTKKRG